MFSDFIFNFYSGLEYILILLLICFHHSNEEGIWGKVPGDGVLSYTEMCRQCFT